MEFTKERLHHADYYAVFVEKLKHPHSGGGSQENVRNISVDESARKIAVLSNNMVSLGFYFVFLIPMIN